MITQLQKGQVRQILQDPRWQVTEQIANELCDKISYESKVRDTEWETLKCTLVDEGQVQGIKRFIKELYNQAQDSV